MAGSYIVRYENLLRSWTKFNGIEIQLGVDIANENLLLNNSTVTIEEELYYKLRKTT